MTTKTKAPGTDLATGGSRELTEAEKQKQQSIAAYAGDVEYSQEIAADDKLIPFLRLIQSNSPQVNPSEAKYIEDAKPGMILNTATNELYTMVAMVLCWRDHNYVEYVPRDSGGGFVSIWPVDDDRIPALRAAQGQFGKLKLESGNELSETYYDMGIVIGKKLDGTATEPFECVVGYASTQIKKHKQRNSRLESLVGKPRKFPDFAFRWMLASMPESNKKGKFFGWRIALDGESAQDAFMPARLADGNPNPLVVRAREFSALMHEGTMKPDFKQAVGADVDGAEAGGTVEGAEEEIPM